MGKGTSISVQNSDRRKHVEDLLRVSQELLPAIAPDRRDIVRANLVKIDHALKSNNQRDLRIAEEAERIMASVIKVESLSRRHLIAKLRGQERKTIYEQKR